MTITPQHAFRDGTAVTLECDSGASNPVSSIRWLKNETEIVDSRITSSSTAAAHGGKATVSRYIRLNTTLYNYSLNGICTKRSSNFVALCSE